MSQPRIVVGAQPRRVPTLIVVFLSGLVGALCALGAQRLWEPPGNGADVRQLETDLRVARQRIERQAQDIATLERGQQIGDAANQELRKEILALEQQTADLRSEISFYQRLLENGSDRRGLVVHELEFRPTSNPRIYFFRLTLTQNLQRVRTTTGDYEITVTGIRDGELMNLTDADLASLAGPYSFKFFDQYRGQVTLPDDFTPESITVRLNPEDNGDGVTREFSWADVVRNK